MRFQILLTKVFPEMDYKFKLTPHWNIIIKTFSLSHIFIIGVRLILLWNLSVFFATENVDFDLRTLSSLNKSVVKSCMWLNLTVSQFHKNVNKLDVIFFTGRETMIMYAKYFLSHLWWPLSVLKSYILLGLFGYFICTCEFIIISPDYTECVSPLILTTAPFHFRDLSKHNKS